VTAARARTITFGVPRPWEPGTTAVVTASTRLSAHGVRGAVLEAATTWSRTQTGRAAIREHRRHGWAFNIGDLAGHLRDHALRRLLCEQGIRRLSIRTVEGTDRLGWEFDDPVVLDPSPRRSTPRRATGTAPRAR